MAQGTPGTAQSLGTQQGGDLTQGTRQQSWDLTPRARYRGHYGQAGTRHVGHGDKAGTRHVGHDAGDTTGDTPVRQEVTCGARRSRHGGKAGKRCWGQCLRRGHAPSPSLSHLLGTVPGLGVPQESRGPGGQGQAEGEAQHSVDCPDEIQAGVDLALQLGTRCQQGGDTVGGGHGGGDGTWGDAHLLQRAEDVSVVLLEAPDPGQPRQSARGLVAVQHPEISQAQG